MSRRLRSFINHPYGPPQPVNNLKFAVVNEEGEIVSAVWTVFPAKDPTKPDIYVTASGTHRAMKFSFHRDLLSHSITSQAHDALVAQGVVPDGSRHQLRVAIPGLPWHGLTLRLAPEVLAKKGHSADEHRGTIVALPVPRAGSVLEIGFILAEGVGLNVRGAQAAIGQVVSGGRALVVVLAFRNHDAAAFKTEMDALVSRAPVPAHMAVRMEPDMDLAMMMYGQDPLGFFTVTEVHNIRYRPAQTGVQPSGDDRTA